MIQTSDHIPKEWRHFMENTQKLTLDYEIISSQVKINPEQFPSDSQLIEYYEDVFCKSTNDASRKKWHQQDKNLLIWCVAKHLLSQGKEELIPIEADWQYISLILDVEKRLLELKWISLLHSNLKISPWSKDEDQLLIEIANECYQKNNWTELTIKFNSKSQTQRYPKQIRERWNNVLNPLIQRTVWTKEEKLQLITLILQYGKKWSKIQDELKGRSENQIKNQYNAIIRSLKKYNVQEVEERALLKNIIENPEQKLSFIVTQFITDLQAKHELQKPKKVDSEPQVASEPTKKVQIESGRTVTDLIPDIKTIDTMENKPLQQRPEIQYQSTQFSTNCYQNYYQYPNQQYQNSFQNFSPYPNYYTQSHFPFNGYQYGQHWPQQQYSYPSYY